MPSPNELVADLQAIANEWRAVATAWHLFLVVLLTSLYVGWRPSARLFLPLLAMPVLGVSVVAGVTGNVFNSSVFAVLALTLGALAFTRADDRVRLGTRYAVSIGAALVAFGAAYPHFVVVDTWIAYVYAAPLGIVPCPTLAVVIGMSLMLEGCDSRAWSWMLVGAGLFYATIGVLWLGVMIDAVLFAGAVALAVHAASLGRGRPPVSRLQTLRFRTTLP
jgi:hypothetical protein